MYLDFPTVFTAFKSYMAAFEATEEGQALLNGRSITVSNVYQETAEDFPLIAIEEKLNVESDEAKELDATETLSTIMYEVSTYDNSANRVEICYTIKDVVNKFFQTQLLSLTTMKFKRTTGEPLPNTANADVFRYVQRFENTK